jgi:hypothetical protein
VSNWAAGFCKLQKRKANRQPIWAIGFEDFLFDGSTDTAAKERFFLE